MEYNITVGKFGAFYVSPGAKGDGLDEKDTASLTPMNTRYSAQIPVMQFTGFKDKNGKEVYEHDILVVTETLDMRYTCEMKWQRNGWWLDDSRGGKRMPNGEWLEVIGNIYENPELLNSNDAKFAG